MQQTMRDDICLVMASMDGNYVAAALNFIGSDALYGRNWGALIHKRFLHFAASKQARRANINWRAAMNPSSPIARIGSPIRVFGKASKITSRANAKR